MLTNRNYVVKEENSKPPENPEISKMGQIRQKLYDAHEKLYKRYGRTAKPAEEATNARLVSVSIVEWVIFLRTKRKERRVWGKFDSCANRNYVLIDHMLSESVKYVSQCDLILDQRFLCVLTEYVLNENDCRKRDCA